MSFGRCPKWNDRISEMEEQKASFDDDTRCSKSGNDDFEIAGYGAEQNVEFDGMHQNVTGDANEQRNCYRNTNLWCQDFWPLRFGAYIFFF